MESKHNESTINRPYGSRLIDGGIVMSDLNAYFIQLMEEEAWQKNDRNSITVFKSGRTTITLIALHKDAELNFNHAQDVDVMNVHVLEGHFILRNSVEDVELYKGQIAVFHEAGNHTGVAKENTLCLLTTINK